MTSPDSPVARSVHDPVPLLRCRVAGRPCAVPVALVERVWRWPLPEPSGFVPLVDVASATTVSGMIGVLVTDAEQRPVIDLHARYDAGSAFDSGPTRLLMCTVGARPVCLVVDTVQEVFTADAARMQPFHSTQIIRTASSMSQPRGPEWPVIAVLDPEHEASVVEPTFVLDVTRLFTAAESARLVGGNRNGREAA